MYRSGSAASLITVNAYWAGLSYMWNALHPIVLPALLASLVPADQKNTYLGLLTFAGLIIAMLIQPLAGAISDRWRSPFGRRRPLMLISTAFSVLFLCVLGWAGGLTWICIGYVGLQLSSNAAQGPLQGLMRDRVAPQQLGVASSIKVFLDLSSLVAASWISARLMSAGTGPQYATFIVIIGLLLVSAAVTALSTREEPSTTLRPRAQDAGQHAPGSPRLLSSGYWWLIAERAAFLLGVYGLQAFGQYYLQDALNIADPVRASGNLLAIVGAGTIVFVIAAGGLADRVGAKRLLYVASGLAATGMISMIAVTDLGGLYGAGSLIGAGMGLFLTSNWALANQMAPAERAGRHLGLTNIATAGAAALARLEGPAVDWLNSAQPGAWNGYRGIFIFGAACLVTSIWFLGKVDAKSA
jgi:MFS family permease